MKNEQQLNTQNRNRKESRQSGNGIKQLKMSTYKVKEYNGQKNGHN